MLSERDGDGLGAVGGAELGEDGVDEVFDAGKELVRTCFLQGNYDFVIGGCQAQPTTKRTKFWGKFGPETAGWDFDTPEDGWKLLDSFLPGVWLYPVLQDSREIRLFFSGHPTARST